MRKGAYRVKGESRVRIEGEGGGVRRRVAESNAIGGSLSKLLGLSEAPSRKLENERKSREDELIEEQMRLQYDANENKLLPGENLFTRNIENINYLLNDLNTLSRQILTRKTIEVEMRLLHGNDPNNAARYSRVLKWLQSNFPDVRPVDFQERTYVVTAKEFEAGYSAEFIWRGESERYIKIKKSDTLSISLPAIVNVNPRLGVSIESDNFAFDTNEAPNTKSLRQRWRFPINMLSTAKLNFDIGSSIIGEPFQSRILRQVQDQQLMQQLEFARGFIDLTRTETDKGIMIYSIEIEIDPSTMQIYIAEGGHQKVVVNDLQYSLLDVWTKILVTIINKTGVYMTSIEKEYVEMGFNACIGETSRRVPKSIVNKPKDLQKRDLSWLSPEKSDMFMQLGNYDASGPSSLRLLKEYGIFKPLMSIPGGYSVSLKADGTRYFVFFFDNGIYLVNPESAVTRITGSKTKAPLLKNILNGTILDAEIVGDFEPTGLLSQFKILVFDILAYNKTDVRNLGYTERQRYMKEVVTQLNDEGFIQSVIKQNEEVMSKLEPAKLATAQLEIPPIMISFSELIKIQLKPIYKLPSLEDVPSDVTDETEILIYRKKLANRFFEILGRVAEASIRSTGARDVIVIDGKEMRPRKEKTLDIEWSTDGIILTPTEQPYLDKSDVFSQNRKSNDHKFSLVRKWKPILTIDFRVVRGESGDLTLFAYSSIKGREVEFTSEEYPWNGNAELDDSMEDKIVEFEWAYSEEFLDYAFIKFKERPDRIDTNSLDIANEVWMLINSPITLEELYGQGSGLSLMRRYHNRIKRGLLTELTLKIKKDEEGKDPRDRKSGVLLDFGSGSGGDRTGWRYFEKVYAVEPDVKNLREFISRQQSRPDVDYSTISGLKSSMPQTKLNKENVTLHYSRAMAFNARSRPVQQTRKQRGETDRPYISIINSKAEDIPRLAKSVPIGSVTCVTMFNALTFFYENMEKLQSMIDSVKTFLVEGGYFYVIAFDGEMLLNSMRHNPGESVSELNTDEMPTYNTIKSKNITISKSPDSSCRKIWIKIEGTIVRGQFEYLINTKEFTRVLELNGFKLIDERYLDEETLLSDEEYWFSSMFKVMKFKYFMNPNKKEIGIYLNKISKQMEADVAVVPLEPTQFPAEIISTQLAGLGFVRLVRFGIPQDGSCYIHAMLRAFSKHYNGLTLAERAVYMIQLRAELAHDYTREIHDRVGNGFFASSQSPAFKYENVRAAISNMKDWVAQYQMSYIGDKLATNVYVLRGVDAIVYRFGDTSDHIKPGRKNIILYWINDNHYETVGIYETETRIRRVFDDNHPLIVALSKLASQ